MWKTFHCLHFLTPNSLLMSLQSGSDPTIPLNRLQPRSPTASAVKFSRSFSIHYLPSWRHLEIGFNPFFLKMCLLLASETPSSSCHFWLLYLSCSVGSSSTHPLNAAVLLSSLVLLTHSPVNCSHDQRLQGQVYSDDLQFFISRLGISPQLQTLRTNYLVDNSMWKFHWVYQTKTRSFTFLTKPSLLTFPRSVKSTAYPTCESSLNHTHPFPYSHSTLNSSDSNV